MVGEESIQVCVLVCAGSVIAAETFVLLFLKSYLFSLLVVRRFPHPQSLNMDFTFRSSSLDETSVVECYIIHI